MKAFFEDRGFVLSNGPHPFFGYKPVHAYIVRIYDEDELRYDMFLYAEGSGDTIVFVGQDKPRSKAHNEAVRAAALNMGIGYYWRETVSEKDVTRRRIDFRDWSCVERIVEPNVVEFLARKKAS